MRTLNKQHHICAQWSLRLCHFFHNPGGKAYATKHREDADRVHNEIAALMRTLLMAVPGGYFVRHQDGDLKYIVAFGSPEAALCWCLAVQECMLYVAWPSSALKNWETEWDADETAVFVGPRCGSLTRWRWECEKGMSLSPLDVDDLPLTSGSARLRLKMGVCEGVPSSIMPDHMGRRVLHDHPATSLLAYSLICAPPL